MASSGLETMMRMQFGECCTTLPTTSLHDFVVGVEQVVAAHAGLARNSGGDDDDVGVGGVGVVVGAEDGGIALLDGHGLEQVETLALGDAFHDVDEDDVGEFLRCDPMSGGGAHVSGTYYRYFISHEVPFSMQLIFAGLVERRRLPVPRGASGRARRPSLHQLIHYTQLLPLGRACCRSCTWQTRWS